MFWLVLFNYTWNVSRWLYIVQMTRFFIWSVKATKQIQHVHANTKPLPPWKNGVAPNPECRVCFVNTMSGWWFGCHFFIFPYIYIYWEFHHPNWRSYISERWPNHQPGGHVPNASNQSLGQRNLSISTKVTNYQLCYGAPRPKGAWMAPRLPRPVLPFSKGIAPQDSTLGWLAWKITICKNGTSTN